MLFPYLCGKKKKKGREKNRQKERERTQKKRRERERGEVTSSFRRVSEVNEKITFRHGVSDGTSNRNSHQSSPYLSCYLCFGRFPCCLYLFHTPLYVPWMPVSKRKRRREREKERERESKSEQESEKKKEKKEKKGDSEEGWTLPF